MIRFVLLFAIAIPGCDHSLAKPQQTTEAMSPVASATTTQTQSSATGNALTVEQRTLAELRTRGYKLNRNPRDNKQWIDQKTGYHIGFANETGLDLVAVLFGTDEASAFWLLDVIEVVSKLERKEALEVSQYLLTQAENKLRNGIRTPTETTKHKTIYSVTTTSVDGMPLCVTITQPTEAK